MAKFIYGPRNGIYIFDLTKTAPQIEAAVEFVKDVVRERKSVLFVGTKKQASQTIKEAALRCGEFYVTERWLGGTLTNLQTIRRSVKRYDYLESLENNEAARSIPKKELAKMRRELAKLRKNLEGIRRMEKLPGALFVVDIVREAIAVHEARRLGIPVVAIVDSNADPDLADFPIAGNDDAIRAISLIVSLFADAVVEAKAELKGAEPIVAEVPAMAEAAPSSVEAAAPETASPASA
jgi:small subunit ribosomal protein S2